MAKPTKYGRQPAAVELYRQQILIIDAADQIGVTRPQLRNVLRGMNRPHPTIVEGLCELLDANPEDLFTEEILEKPYDPKHNPWKRVTR